MNTSKLSNRCSFDNIILLWHSNKQGLLMHTNTFRKVIFVIILPLLYSCATPQCLIRKSPPSGALISSKVKEVDKKLNLGMTELDAIKLLGKPDNKIVNGNMTMLMWKVYYPACGRVLFRYTTREFTDGLMVKTTGYPGEPDI